MAAAAATSTALMTMGGGPDLTIFKSDPPKDLADGFGGLLTNIGIGVFGGTSLLLAAPACGNDKRYRIY